MSNLLVFPRPGKAGEVEVTAELPPGRQKLVALLFQEQEADPPR